MSGETLSIDPGSGPLGSACAYFTPGGHLRDVMFSKRPGGASVSTVVIEALQFRGMVDLPRAQRLIKMAAAGYLAAGYALASGGDLVELTPGEWKGQEAKPMQHARLWRVLNEREKGHLGAHVTSRAIARAIEKGALDRWRKPGVAYYPASFKMHNLLDAAALGATYLGRLEKR